MTPWEFLLLALAAYRTWQLVAEDDVLDPIRRRVFRRVPDWLACPWCSGFWIAAGWLVAFWVWADVIYAAGLFAASTVVGLVALTVSHLADE